ncbi:MAG: peptidyl-prolyl cis-trans isomerase [Planctomycetaceae bacterium]|nr:peptidyl-prolyl cis-trans isomerase [Planctomycetaceae bacterium]
MPFPRHHAPTHRIARTSRFRRWTCAAVICGGSFLTGCASTKKADNPVVGPRPPRLSDSMLAQMEAGSDSRDGNSTSAATTDYLQASGQVDHKANVRTAILEETAANGGSIIREEDVAARVNGNPIFVSEVLERYGPQLEAQRAQISATDYQRVLRGLLEQELPAFIEQALVLDAARAQFKQDQWDELQDKLDEFFYSDEVPNLQQRLKVSSLREVEIKMQEVGTSLVTYRRIWGERQIAGQWVSEKLPDATASRQELLEEYNRRIDEYREPEQVQWQQCWISIAESGGRDGGRKRVQQVIEELKAGKSFDDVVAAHSDGPRASDRGRWDWTQTSSLADERLKQTLTTLKLDQIGPVLEDDRGFRLVKLTGFRPEQVKPFEEVQAELREAIVQEKRSVAAQQVIDDLKAKAQIETILDSPTANL